MDERVYEAIVCASCLTQLPRSLEGLGPECSECGSEEFGVTVRFRVSRSAVLKQAAPRESLIERTLYYGCVGDAGHYYWHRGSEGRPYKAAGYGAADYAKLTPWGHTVDGGLFPRHTRLRDGEAHIFHKDGWTALAFTDRSVDSRPGSWSIFCIPEILDGPEALNIARAAFPPIFARYEFPVELAK